MKVWTVQPLSALEEIQKTGTFRCRKELSYNLSKQDSLKPHYEWLMRQMDQRIGDKPAGVEYPIWAWHTWDYERRCPEPDSAAFLKRAEDKVLFALDIPEDELLLSDFDAWQIVMMGGYLMSAEEYAQQDQLEEYLASLSPQIYRQEVEKSWMNVFRTEAVTLDGEQRGRYIQATFWELKEAYIQEYQILHADTSNM